MNYFEVIYKNCFGELKKALVATLHKTPEIPTANFNFNWNGNKLIKWHKTSQYNYSRNIYQF